MAAVLSGFQLYRLGFTLGIGDLWLTPYRSAAAAAFYRELVPLEKGEEAEEMQETQTEEDVILEE